MRTFRPYRGGKFSHRGGPGVAGGEDVEGLGELRGADDPEVGVDAGRVTDPDEAKQIVWGQVVGADGFHVMAFDVPAARAFDRGVESFFVSVRGRTVEEVETLWTGLADGATVREPFGPSGWSPAYGMLTDRFGVTWVLDVAVAY